MGKSPATADKKNFFTGYRLPAALGLAGLGFWLTSRAVYSEPNLVFYANQGELLLHAFKDNAISYNMPLFGFVAAFLRHFSFYDMTLLGRVLSLLLYVSSFALGAAGGGRIPPGVVQVISRIIDDGMPLPKALAAPRVYMGGGTLEAETSPFTGWTPEQVAEMRALGLEVRENPGVGSFSRVHAIQYDPATNTWTAGADPDWEGSAQGPNRGRRPGGPAR